MIASDGVELARVRDRDDLALVYTPGVPEVSAAIPEQPSLARSLTIKGNSVAVVSDGSAVLGLGDVGPEAAMPVMEGKALLFKECADIDAFPLCVDVSSSEELIAVGKAIAPTFGGINLEDIASPRCFEVERALKDALDIPVFHDDQHGTAVVVLAALMNAARATGRSLDDLRIVVRDLLVQLGQFVAEELAPRQPAADAVSAIPVRASAEPG